MSCQTSREENLSEWVTDFEEKMMKKKNKSLVKKKEWLAKLCTSIECVLSLWFKSFSSLLPCSISVHVPVFIPVLVSAFISTLVPAFISALLPASILTPIFYSGSSAILWSCYMLVLAVFVAFLCLVMLLFFVAEFQLICCLFLVYFIYFFFKNLYFLEYSNNLYLINLSLVCQSTL